MSGFLCQDPAVNARREGKREGRTFWTMRPWEDQPEIMARLTIRSSFRGQEWGFTKKSYVHAPNKYIYSETARETFYMLCTGSLLCDRTGCLISLEKIRES